MHRTITITKGEAGFGFNIVGPNSADQPRGIYVSVIKPKGAAEQQGELKVGDQIFSVNERGISHLNHTEAADVLRTSGQSVTLDVAHNPEGMRIYVPQGPVDALFPLRQLSKKEAGTGSAVPAQTPSKAANAVSAAPAKSLEKKPSSDAG